MEPIIICPHCDAPILIEKLNCGIFRHGIIKKTGKQVDPHASKDLCDNLITQDMIYGCGKPFQIVEKEGSFVVTICEYI